MKFFPIKNQTDKNMQEIKKFIIPKLCKTKYKALRLRNPSVILGALRWFNLWAEFCFGGDFFFFRGDVIKHLGRFEMKKMAKAQRRMANENRNSIIQHIKVSFVEWGGPKERFFFLSFLNYETIKHKTSKLIRPIQWCESRNTLCERVKHYKNFIIDNQLLCCS
jgi:hypothetical protein